MDLEEGIRGWVSVDNSIRLLNQKSKELREQRTELASGILEQIRAKGLSDQMIKITDGHLRFTPQRQRAPLTYQHVRECLVTCLPSEAQADQLIQYIKDRRSTSEAPVIRRFASKD